MTLSLRQLFITILALMTLCTTAKAKESVSTDQMGYRYYTLSPDITTNFSTNSDNLGFIRVGVELMLENPSDISIIEHHAPLIRDTIISVLTKQNSAQIHSVAGREAIRLTCLEQVNELLIVETNKKVVTELLFTKYLYQ